MSLKKMFIKKSKFEWPETEKVMNLDPEDNRRVYGFPGAPTAGILVRDLPIEEKRKIKQVLIDQAKDMPTITTKEVREMSRMRSDAYNEATRGKHYDNEVRFSFYNQNKLMNALGYKYAMKFGTWNKYTDTPRAIDMVKAPKHKDEPILIIGSGPTFDEFAPYLKDWKGDIMVSTSQASTCIALGKEPTYIMALDPNSNMGELENVDTWKDRKSILITHPGVTPNLIEGWKGPMYLFRKLQPQTAFYENEQKIGYSTLGNLQRGSWGFESEILLTGVIPMLACVLAAQICTAKQLGYKRQYLVGCDFGMPNDQSRFTSYGWEKDKWVVHPAQTVAEFAADEAHWGMDGPSDSYCLTEDGVATSPMFVFYAHQTITAWRITEADIVSASDKGVIKIFPSATPEEIVRKQGKGIKGYNLQKIRWETEKYLAVQNIYFLYVGNGVMPHEFKDPLHDVPKMLDEVEKALIAQGKGQLLDKTANMKRIYKLFEHVAERK